MRTPSGGYHLYFEHTDGVRNSQDAYGIGIDVRGEGGYVLAPGAVTEGGTYKCLERDVETAQLLALPFPEGCCQTNANQSLQGQYGCPLCRAKTAPLGESGGAVGFEMWSAGEASFLVEVV